MLLKCYIKASKTFLCLLSKLHFTLGVKQLRQNSNYTTSKTGEWQICRSCLQLKVTNSKVRNNRGVEKKICSNEPCVQAVSVQDYWTGLSHNLCICMDQWSSSHIITKSLILIQFGIFVECPIHSRSALSNKGKSLGSLIKQLNSKTFLYVLLNVFYDFMI